MAEQAQEIARRHKAMVLIGDLGDINAVGRRDGFEDAVAEFPETIEVVARVPTEWSQDKALDGVRNALYAHPEIDFIFTSSDFLFASLVAALKDAGKYHKVGQPGHVLLGGFDGDSTAYRMLVDGYLDACGVQDVYYECSASIDALLRMRSGESVEPIIRDPGFVIHQGNLAEKTPQMWARSGIAPGTSEDRANMATADATTPHRESRAAWAVCCWNCPSCGSACSCSWPCCRFVPSWRRQPIWSCCC